MKKVFLALFLSVFMSSTACVWAQEKGKPEATDKSAEAKKDVTPLRIQIVFTEFDGDKKISNLPYTLLMNADDKGPLAALRMGLRVPIVTSAGESKQYQYVDLGTNMDGRAEKTDDGRFSVKLNVEKSSAYSPGSGQKAASVGGNEITSAQPVIQSFRSQVNLLVRDGQTVQSTMATDPVTGHVLRVEVTLNVVK